VKYFFCQIKKSGQDGFSRITIERFSLSHYLFAVKRRDMPPADVKRSGTGNGIVLTGTPIFIGVSGVVGFICLRKADAAYAILAFLRSQISHFLALHFFLDRTRRQSSLSLFRHYVNPKSR